MKSGRKIITGMFALVVCGVLAAVFWPEKPEPVYKGRKLSKWVDELMTPQGMFNGETEVALKAIGTNGIPFYVEWVQYEPGLAKRAQDQLAQFGRRWLGFQWDPANTNIARARGALVALGMLGEKAEPAMPMFMQMATNAAALPGDFSLNDPFTGYVGLLGIGRPAVPAFLSLMTNQDPRVRANAIAMSVHYCDNYLMAQVRTSLQDRDQGVRAAATNALKTFGTGDKP